MRIMLDGNNGNNCWNNSAFTQFGKVADGIEAKLSQVEQVDVYAGQIACNGCGESDTGVFCAAELTQTTVAIMGRQLTPSQPEVPITMVPGFRLYAHEV